MKYWVSLFVLFVGTVSQVYAADFNVSNSGAAAYLINGESNPTLTLERGQTYEFDINAPGHPFWIKIDPTTGTGDVFNDGVTGNGETSGTLTFAVPESAPDTLYYICQFHGAMVGTIEITDAPQSIVDIAAGDPNFSTLVTALESTGLDTTLAGAGPFTVFAPTNDAFDDLDPDLLSALLADTDALTQVLLYHVLSGEFLSGALSDGTFLTVQGNVIEVSLVDGVSVNDASVVIPDIEASNGVIHVIDEVLIPPTIVDIALGIDGEFETLAAALGAADLVDTLQGLGPFTVFAPTDAAFDNLPAGVLDELLADPEALSQVLLYHVVAGRVFSTDLVPGTIETIHGAGAVISEADSDFFIDAARIIEVDIQGLNGVIHVIDEVILPPTQTIVEIAAANPAFSTLVTALEATELDEVLSGPGPFTVFAPTDDAFDLLPPGTIPALLADLEELTDILLYHVVSGRVRSGDLEAGRIITVQGAAAEIALTPPTIDGVTISITDIEASNGVIHVIDAVLELPPTIAEIVAGNPNDFSTLQTALETAGLVDALNGPGPFTVFAPNDFAFGNFPEPILAELLAHPSALAEVLLYHVVSGRIRQDDLVTGAVSTLQGAPIVIDAENGTVLEFIAIESFDIEARNGVIHVIDDVLPIGAGFVEAGGAGMDRILSRIDGNDLRLIWFSGADIGDGPIPNEPQLPIGGSVVEFTSDLTSGEWETLELGEDDLIDVVGVTVAIIPIADGAAFYRVQLPDFGFDDDFDFGLDD